MKNKYILAKNRNVPHFITFGPIHEAVQWVYERNPNIPYKSRVP